VLWATFESIGAEIEKNLRRRFPGAEYIMFLPEYGELSRSPGAMALLESLKNGG
jgi:hypothetical protein